MQDLTPSWKIPLARIRLCATLAPSGDSRRRVRPCKHGVAAECIPEVAYGFTPQLLRVPDVGLAVECTGGCAEMTWVGRMIVELSHWDILCCRSESEVVNVPSENEYPVRLGKN